MASKKQVEDAIRSLEGFRVELEPFEGKKSALPAYDYPVMAPQRWKISEWKNRRLERYRLLIKSATIFRGDGTSTERDLQLGNLRDTYYEAECGPIAPAPAEAKDEKAVAIEKRRKKRLR